MQQKYGDQVRFVGVAGRDDLEPIQDFVANLGVDGFTHAVDEDLEIWGEYGIRSQPAFAFLNADGSVEVHAGKLGLDSLTQRVEALIAA